MVQVPTVLLEAWYLSYFQMSAPFNFGPTYTFDWKGRNSILDWWNWWNPLQNWHQTVTKVHEVYFVEHCCHVYQTHRSTFPHLDTLLFLNFQVKICQDIEFDPNKKAAKSCNYFFCSRIAASTKRGEAWRRNQEEIKSMSPTLIDERLCKTGINLRCTLFSWETCDMFISFRTTETETLSIFNIVPSWNPFLLNFHIKDEYWNKNTQPNPGYQRLTRSTFSSG